MNDTSVLKSAKARSKANQSAAKINQNEGRVMSREDIVAAVVEALTDQRVMAALACAFCDPFASQLKINQLFAIRRDQMAVAVKEINR